jgi:predicted nucleic acid-binding Zn ribbon protein
MARKDSQVERLSDVLAKSLKRLDLGPRLDEYGVWPVWRDVVGEPIARNAQPEKIRNGTLFVKVSSPVWMQQLQFMKEMIAETINQRLRAEIVKNIFFVVGRMDSGPSETQVALEPAQPATAARSELDEEFLESVEDPEIRQAFKKLLRSYVRRKRKI